MTMPVHPVPLAADLAGKPDLPRKSSLLRKPSLRGVSHEVAFYVSLVAGPALVWAAPAGRAVGATLVYTVCLAALFGLSALYHRPTWQPVARQRMRRLDHAGIFFQIAGTYTPVCLLALDPATGQPLLTYVWAAAAFGMVKSVWWVHAPKPVTAGLYLAMSWAIVAQWSAVADGLGPRGMALLIGGGVLYSVGAVIYARRWPDPRPAAFGYHEIFHLLVVLAAGCHFEMVRAIVMR